MQKKKCKKMKGTETNTLMFLSDEILKLKKSKNAKREMKKFEEH